MKKIVFGFIAVIMFSLVGNSQTRREEFLKGKTYDQVIIDFNNLKNDEKLELWIDKLNQLIKQELPAEHRELISVLREEFVKRGYDSLSDRSIEIVVKLANITPDKDFQQMFESLFDYNFTGKFKGCDKLSDEIIKDLSNINSNIKIESTSRVPCSCRWCIGIDHTYNNCTPSERGCGFLWLQSCTKSITGW